MSLGKRVQIKIPPEVARKIGYYVYLLIDPRNGRTFYVGKGKGSRAIAHLDEKGSSDKVRLIRKLRSSGLEPRVDILAHGLSDELTAFRVEASVIDALGLDQLTNRIRGQSVQLGRMPVQDLIAHYGAKPVVVAHPAMLIRINALYRHGMSRKELYEATRGVWRVDRERAATVEYALAVFEGVVRQVYAIKSWHRAGSTRYWTRRQLRIAGRSEFVGRVADDSIRLLYVNGSVRRYLPRGLQSPIVYCNC